MADLGLISALNSLQGAYAVVVFVLLGALVTPLFGGALTSGEGRAKTTKGAAWAFASKAPCSPAS